MVPNAGDPVGDRGRDGTRAAAPVIAVIRKGADVGNAAEYLFGPGDHGDHVDPPVVAGVNVMLGDSRGRDWVADMRFCAGLRPSLSRLVWHYSLRAAPQDSVLGDARWAAIAGQFVAALGLARHPWVAVRRGGTHVHILTGRVNALRRGLARQQ